MSVPANAATRRTFTDRLVGALRLESAVYEELEADRSATLQAALVVVLGAVATGLGSGLSAGIVGFAITTLIALASWSLYAWIVYFFGTTVFKGPETKADWGEVARTVGFANAPRIVLALRALSDVASLVTFGVALWTIAATVVAVRAALDVTTGRAAIIAVVAGVAQAVITILLLSLQGY